MKRLLAGVLSAGMVLSLLSGCRPKVGDGAPETFDGESLTGWKMSEGASYSLSPETGVSGVLQKSGLRYLSTGKLQPAYAVTDNTLQIERYYSAMETESYWRGLFFTSDTMQLSEEQAVSADVTVEVGSLAGICVGTDSQLSNGYAAVIHLAKQRVEILRVNQGILTSLEKYQEGVTTNSLSVEIGTTYTLGVTYRATGENACAMTVSVNGQKLLDTTLSGYGVAQGRGQQVSLVASDMKGSFQNLTVGGQAISLDDGLRVSEESPTAVDETFKGAIISEPFTINSKFLSFKAGGKKDSESLKICLLNDKTNEVLFTETGSGSEEMTRRLWNVEPYIGKSCRIQIEDNLKSAHLNVDAFIAVNQEPLDTQCSLLNSQVGYSTDASKKAYIRAPESVNNGPATFQVRNYTTGEPVFEGRVRKQGSYWESNWWELDFTELRQSGRFVIVAGEGRDTLVSTAFDVGQGVLVNHSLLDTSLNQLDLRRSPNKLGWRDSSTDELRELHAQVMTVHTMLDLLETQDDWLTPYNRARVLDNIEFGLRYILTAQERTDDPKTDGRFIHDLYPSQYSAHKLRSWFDTTYAMSALSRAYPVLQDNASDMAVKVKDAFDVSFRMCVLRPYYLPEEFDVEGPNGLQGVESSIRQLYYLREMSWTFTGQLRTRDKLMFMNACTYMAKADSDPRYLEQAKKLAKEINDAQYTDYQNPIDGAYGCFYEFENNREAMMLEWVQAFNLLLGNQTPTDLRPFMDLLELAPADPDAAMWYNTLQTYANGYVKKTASLTPLGIYPIAAYNNAENRGVKFFQTISHGASSHYGLIGRNIQQLALFFGDSELQNLAQNNVQFQAGLNPGFPTDTNYRQWKSFSLLYLVGSRYFSGSFSGGAYTPPIGSGFNGFSASQQFSVETIAQAKDMPLGILDGDGNYQFNEDYIPHGMGYSSGSAAVDASVRIPVVTTLNGQPVAAQIHLSGAGSGTINTDGDGKGVLTGIAAGQPLMMEFAYNGQSVRREITAISGEFGALNVDFAEEIQAVLHVPKTLDGTGRGELTLTNTGMSAVEVSVSLYADGATIDIPAKTVSLRPGETVTTEFALTAGEKSEPYLVYAYLLLPHHAVTATGAGLVA